MARMRYPVTPSILAADHASLVALQSLLDYQPIHAIHSVTNLVLLQTTLAQARQATHNAEIALEAARSIEAQTSHAYHDAMVGARSHVVVQYGPDAAAVEQIGLTRKSNRKRPTRRKLAAA